MRPAIDQLPGSLIREVANVALQAGLGRSDVLRVTIREQAKFDADVLEITARQEFWRAESDLRAADTSIGPNSASLLPQLVLPVVPEAIPAPQPVRAPVVPLPAVPAP